MPVKQIAAAPPAHKLVAVVYNPLHLAFSINPIHGSFDR